MSQKIIDLNLKKEVKQLKMYPELKILNLDFERILQDIYFFKNHLAIAHKSEVLFNKIYKITRNYPKSVVIQHDFVEEFKKMG